MSLSETVTTTIAAVGAAIVMLFSAACGNSAKEAATSVSQTEATPVTETTAASETVKTEQTGAAPAPRTYEELKDKKVIALTFDDGPNTTTTKEILDLVEQYGIRVSFFVIGQNINDESAKQMKRAYALGCEINSHSYTHSSMDKMSTEDIKAEMEKTAGLIYDNIGEYPKFFRPPYIAVNPALYEAIDLPFISGIGCNDWEDSVSVEKRVAYVTKKCGDGCIVLLHDSQGNTKTVEALKEIIPYFLDEGYVFVTTTELFTAKGITPRADKEIIYSYATETGWSS